MNIKISHPIAIQRLGHRDNQEDSIYPPLGEATSSDRIFLVCDGMGGHEHGEIASDTVCKVIGNFFTTDTEFHTLTDKDLLNAVDRAYDALDDADTNTGKTMGTTLTFVGLHNQGCLVGHTGDSRVYHFRPSERKIWHTRDHSLVQNLFEIGDITEEEMKTHPRRNVITKAMLPHRENRVMPTMRNIQDIRPGDWIMLCSDGVTERSDDSDFLDILSDTSLSLDMVQERLIDLIGNNNDNHSAYLFRIEYVDNPINNPEDAFQSKSELHSQQEDETPNHSYQHCSRRPNYIKLLSYILLIIAVIATAILLYSKYF